MESPSKSEWIEVALRQHESSLIRYAAWILSDVERAREVVQETFLRLCKESPRSVGDHLPQWLFTVCRNLAYDVRKKESRMTPLSEAPVRDPASGELLERRETMGRVMHVLEALPKNQREVIYLKFQCDLSYKEISEITGLSVSNIGFLIHTGIQAMKSQLLPAHANARRTQ